jgi:hypothetical protein
MLVILGGMIYAGEYFYPERSTPEDLEKFKFYYDFFGLEEKVGTWAKWALWWLITSIAMNGITWAMLLYFLQKDPLRTPKTHLWNQAKVILTNFALLPIGQLAWDILEQKGYTKATMGNYDLYSVIRDSIFWMLCFEWAWYF